MPPAAKKDKVISLKGEDAEEAVLDYMKKMNRPFAATDISANLHGLVSKPLTQKALVALSGKGRLAKKEYGKQTIFVYPQDSLPESTPTSLAALDDQLAALQPQIDEKRRIVRALQGQVAALGREPRTDELEALNAALQEDIASKRAQLTILQSGAPPVSPSAVTAAHAAWQRERTQWVARRGVYAGLVDSVLGEAGGEARRVWEEEVGVEGESEEDRQLEKSDLVSLSATRSPALPASGPPRAAVPVSVEGVVGSKRKLGSGTGAASAAKKAK